MLSGVAISSDATGRSSWENILGSVIQSTCFSSMFATSKSFTASDECLQSPFKVLTVTGAFLPSTFNCSSKLFFTKLETKIVKHSPGSNPCA